MALFNKLFSPRRKTYTKNQDNVCNRLFTFSKDQVRVVLFRECDFRGRKLLFDSNAVQKMPIDTTNLDLQSENPSSNESKSKNEKFAEISNKFGYVYTKPSPDIGQLGEMVFGSVAMSYRGTSFKIHSLKSPSRIMCTQVFPSPRHTKKCRSSAPTVNYINTTVASTQNSEHSILLNDSGASSTTSVSDHLSSQSNTSDSLLVCRGPRSTPLDVPILNAPSSSIVGDSGFCGEQSLTSSVGSGPQSCNWDLSFQNGNGTINFSSNSLYRRWLRSTSTSLEYSGNSLTGPASADEFLLKPHPRTSKLGLAIIINLSTGEEENMIQFLMEHIALIESLVWRSRQGAEAAYIRSHSFVSLMYDISACISQWLVDLLSGPQLTTNLWLVLSNTCDKVNSISVCNKTVNSDKLKESRSASLTTLVINNKVNNLNNSNSSSSIDVNFKDDKLSSFCDPLFNASSKSDFTFSNITKLLKSEWEAVSGKKIYYNDKNYAPEKFVTELCELLETVDVKQTNFFISTLLTAVLTHHLGWVTTSLQQSDKETISEINFPTNPLWGQLTDLFGAVGYPPKITHTIVTGSSRSDLITKILNLLTYFIRCSDIKRKSTSRVDVNKENEIVSSICQKNSCIPKENYKKYEDHLREMAILNHTTKNKHIGRRKDNGLINACDNKEQPKKLIKTHTCNKDLSKLNDENNLYPQLKSLCKEEMDEITVNSVELQKNKHEILDKVKNLNIQAVMPFELTNTEINEKVNKLCRVPPDAVMYHFDTSKQNLVDLNTASEEILKAFSPKKVNMEKQMKSTEFSFEKVDIEKFSSDEKTKTNNVIFVLGDNEELVGLKNNCKNNIENNRNFNNKLTRPNSLNISTEKCNWDFSESLSDSKLSSADFKDCYFTKYCGEGVIKPSTSYNSLNCNKENVITNHAKIINLETECTATCSNKPEKEFIRSQSVPPTDCKSSHDYDEVKSKYRYSGVKFNFQQYPQIFTNYLKSKNLTLSEKTIQLDSIDGESGFDFTNYDGNSEEIETLQTPSNASELEFTSDLFVEKQKKVDCNNKNYETSSNNNNNKKTCNGEKKMASECETELTSKKMKLISLPMPKFTIRDLPTSVPIGYTSSLMRGMTDHYISDMILQGTTAPKTEWEAALRSDLILAARHPVLDQPIDEAVAIIANIDTWEVQLMSSHTYVVDRGSTGVRVGMSQLVANMLESLLHMWRLHAPPEYCLMHIEQRLQEFCVRSKALAQLLLATEFCSMELLTSTLQLEVNDVPLLMAIASTHSPQVTQKYGLSFQ